jgi:hypothetical protein
MLSQSQKYSIASMLAINTLDAATATIERFNDSAVSVEASDFARRIDKFYRKRDGFVPRRVIDIINGKSPYAEG